MDNILKLKVVTISIYGIISSLFFYDDNFLQNSFFLENPHQYNHFAFMVAVLSLGIIFSAFIYNLVFYIYIRNRQYLYYSLAQLSVLISLVLLEALLINPFIEIYNFKSFYLLDISQIAVLIFSLLFIKEFFQIRIRGFSQESSIRDLQNSIKIVIYLALFDLFLSLFLGYTSITKFVPTPIWIAFVLSEVYRTVKERDVPFYSIMIGWGFVVIVLLLEILYIINPHKIDFPMLHIAFAFESMMLSFAMSYRFKLIADKEKMQQSLLLQQSRLASMGEMISTIAHQWRQPLTFLSYSLMFIKQKAKEDKELIETVNNANAQLQYMSKTIENFRNFYNPSKKRANFSVEKSCQNIFQIVRPTLTPLKIEIALEVIEDFTLFGNSNELEQVLLNIINNAKDVLVERKIENPKIEIIVVDKQITIKDNGGGVKAYDQDKIFEPYFSTKEKSDGIGLYIAKTIIEGEMNGLLYFISDHKKTEFIIQF